jgi:hypothetical protein
VITHCCNCDDCLRLQEFIDESTVNRDDPVLIKEFMKAIVNIGVCPHFPFSRNRYGSEEALYCIGPSIQKAGEK